MEEIAEERIIQDLIQYRRKSHAEKSSPKVLIPKNKYVLCQSVFFLLGICHFMPITFFSAANNFWLDKFKNVSHPDSSASNRTILQKNFASATLVSTSASSLLFGIFNVMYLNRFRIMDRLLVTLGINVAVFVFFTVSVKVNTDDYQLPFFISVLIATSILSGASAVNLVSTMNLYPRFPDEFTTICLIGEGSGTIFSDIMNIVAVAVYGGEIINATFVYFLFGTSVFALTLILTIFLSRETFFWDCVATVPQDMSKKLPTIKETVHIFYKVRIGLAILSLTLMGMALSHTAVTSLVVSEQPKETSAWAENYFTPVMTFLLSGVTALMGRIFSSFKMFKLPRTAYLILAVARLTLVPCIWLCNAQPRKHLPVVFSHDYQYGIILGLFMMTGGFLINKATLTVSETVDDHMADMAYTLFGLGISVVQILSSICGLFIVNVI